MSKWTRRKVKQDLEHQILFGMIVSDVFLKSVANIYRPEYMEGPISKLVAGWCLEYLETYGSAPGGAIVDVFAAKVREGELDEDVADIIGKFIEQTERMVEDAPDLNSDYLLDQTVQYFKRRSLQILCEDITASLATESPEEAEEILTSFRRVQLDLDSGVDPFTEEEKIVEAFNDDDKPIMRFPGVMGELVNPLLTRDSFIGIMGPEKRGKCLAGDQRVWLTDGRLVRIDELVEKRERAYVWTLNERTGKLEAKRIVDFHIQGRKPCHRITTRTGRSVVVTANHPFLTPNGWKKLEDLEVGDRIAVPRSIKPSETQRPEEWQPRVLAYMIANGCLMSRSPVFSSLDRKLVDDLNRLVKQADCELAKRRGSTLDYGIRKTKGTTNGIAEWLDDLGLMGKRSREKHLPPCVFRWDVANQREFLRTLFTCDGYVTKDEVGYSSSSYELARDVHLLLLHFGIPARLSKKKAQAHWTVVIRSMYYRDLFIRRIGFLFDKQKKALGTLSDKRTNCFLDTVPFEVWAPVVSGELEGGRYNRARDELKRGAPLSRRRLMDMAEEFDSEAIRQLVNQDVLWDYITDIKPEGEMETFDISIEDNHNFVAEGIVVHNSWILIEFAVRALKSKCNVAFFSVGDMSEKQLIRRFHIHLARRSHKRRYCGRVMVPVLDCLDNQQGTCTRHKDRENDIVIGEELRRALFEAKDKAEKMEIVEQVTRDGYKPCTVCRKEWWFRGAPWYELRDIKPLQPKEAVIYGKRFMQRLGGARMKMSAYPNSTISVAGIETVLDKWEDIDGFVPDVILIDYADILAPESPKLQGRDIENERWKALRRLSQTRHCLVVTATQTDTKSYKETLIKRENFSEDKRKYAHVVGMLTLNQTLEERRMGLMRLGVLMARDEEYDEKQTVTLLQCLQIGRPLLASYKT